MMSPGIQGRSRCHGRTGTGAYDRPNTLFYLDPPYWGTEGYGVEFGLEDYGRMAELAQNIRGRMVISVNDIPEMRVTFTGLFVDQASIRYSVGGSQKFLARAKELIIRNFD